MSRFLKLSAPTVRASLKAHSGFGLFISALLYLVCLTGVIAVFYPEFERWEQASIKETLDAKPDIVQKAIENLLAWHEENNPDAKPFEDVWIGLPTVEMPRFYVGGHIETIEAQFFVNADGSLGEKVDHEWTHFLVKLHYALTVPGIWGMVLVGVIGMVLVGLVISGIAAHPTIFKNAFSLRVNRGIRQQQVDLHNRIGVWSAPFLLIIALTGAMIGLGQIFLFAFANSFFEGDTTRIANAVFMPHPEATNVAAPLMNTAPILEKFAQDNPGLLPYYFSIHFPATTAQLMEIGAYLPDRLVWYEAFQFNPEGEQVKRLGWSDGDIGAQIYGSTYRLHFGHYGGLPVKIIYALFGVGMCYLCITGMNIWFRRQQQAGNPRLTLERTWTAVVWGFPLAISLGLLVDFFIPDQHIALFWITSLLFISSSAFFKTRQQISAYFPVFIIGVLISILIIHAVKHGAFAFNGASLLINLLLLIAILLLITGRVIKRKSLSKNVQDYPATDAPALDPLTHS